MTTRQPVQAVDYTAMLASMVQQEEALESADDPAQTDRPGDLLERNEVWGAPSVVSEATGKWVTLYHTITGMPHVMLEHNAKDALKRVHKDPAYPVMLGKFVFSAKPTVKPRYGTFKCWLHPDYPGAKLRHEQGFPVCMSEHLASAFQVEEHMRLKHKTSYAAMMREREDERQRAALTLQEKQIAALLAMGQRQSAMETWVQAPVADPFSNPIPIPHEASRPQQKSNGAGALVTKTCKICGAAFSAPLARKAAGRLRWHRDKVHNS